jgi:hypothetical protein
VSFGKKKIIDDLFVFLESPIFFLFQLEQQHQQVNENN